MKKYNEEELNKLRDLIKGIDTAMLTTQSPEGLVSRPMKTQEVEFDGDLWFFTKKDTDKYDEIVHNADVNVAYADKSFVSIRGQAEAVADNGKKKELWNAAYEKLMGTSYDDPNVILIKVHAEAAEYWDSGSLTKNVVNLFSKLAGKDKKDPADMNETIELD